MAEPVVDQDSKDSQDGEDTDDWNQIALNRNAWIEHGGGGTQKTEDISVEGIAWAKPQHNPNERQDDGLPVDVEGHFLVMETKDADGGQFADPLCHIDGGQIKEDDHGQENG